MSSVSLRCQFAEIAPFCDALANAGKVVVVAALDGTFQRKPFGAILDLVPMVSTICLFFLFVCLVKMGDQAESVTKLSAICAVCYKVRFPFFSEIWEMTGVVQEAAFSRRIGSETEVEVIGGSEKYTAVCRRCFVDGHVEK